MFTDKEFDILNETKKLPIDDDRAILLFISKFKGADAATLTAINGLPEKLIMTIRQLMLTDPQFKVIILTAVNAYFVLKPDEYKNFLTEVDQYVK